MSWTDQRDALPNGAVGLPIVLNLRFWMEPGEMQPAQVQAIAAQQLAKTNQLFWENRVGVELYDLPFDSMVGAASPCFLSWNIPSPVKPGVLNVYFVHRGITAPHGMYCVSLSGSVLTHHDAILFNLDRSDPSTLAHEVSHAFGLLFPSWGHPYSVEGILSTNLMLGNLTGLSRGHLSVGQVLRMHLDKESYLSRRAGTGTACQHDGSRNPCPALGLDLYSKSPVTP
jgi:hypothetical protein